MSVKQISLSCNIGEDTIGKLEITTISLSSRIFKACLYLLLTLIVAACSLLVPLLHFILPPIILVAGLYIVYLKFNQSRLILGGSATCPACQAEVRILTRIYQSKLKDFCEKCQRDLNITIID